MKTYTHKTTGQKITEAQYNALKNRKAAQKRARLFLVSAVSSMALITGSFVLSNIAKANNNFDHLNTVEVRIQPGQTAWDIIKALTPEENTDRILFEMGALNPDINLSDVKAYSDVVTFYVSPSVDAHSIEELNIVEPF